MPWIECHIIARAELVNEFSDRLSELGALAVTFQDAGDQPIFEPAPETPRLWPETKIISLFDHNHPMEDVILYLEDQASLGLIKNFHTETLADEDWERRCLDSFKPIQCGKRLWICPSWQTPPDPNAVNVILDPGLAFGTGTHPTTALCLEWLDANIKNQETVIDYGCGSGILGIAALKLGAKRVIAVDNDPQALLATRDNCERNSIDSKRLITLSPEQFSIDTGEIIIANILAQPLIELAEYFAQILPPNGKIVLSGVLEHQINDLFSAYCPFFVIQWPACKDGWVRIEGIRK